MPFFRPSEPIADHPFVPRELIREEPWGEIWRANWKDGRPVILVAYTTPEGDELFEEAEPHLQKWKTVSEGTVAPHLLRILEISSSAIPYVIMEDPGGLSVREYTAGLDEPVPLKIQGRIALCAAHAMTQGESYDVAPIGLSPDTIFQNEKDRDYPWRVLPVAPGTRLQAELLCGGRYFPDTMKMTPRPARMHPDSFSLAWLWLDIFRKDFESPSPVLERAIPYKGLQLVLQMCLEMKKGAFSEPNVVMMGVERWVRRQMAEDIAEERENQRARKRGIVGNFFYYNRAVFGKLAIAVAVIAVLAGVGAGIYYAGFFDRPKSPLYPDHTLEMFYGALLSGDAATARKFLAGGVDQQVDDMTTMIEKMEEEDTIAQWTRHRSVLAGSGTTRVAETTFYDNDRRPFAKARIQLNQRANLEWSIASIFFQPDG